MTANRPLNFAIIGCGVIAPCHARCIAELEAARLTAVCDLIEAKAQHLAETYHSLGGEPVAVYTDAAAMLRQPDIDVVAVLTPSGLHAELGMAAAGAGKHVIVEKPIDVTLEKAQALVQTCRAAGVKLCAISQHRFDFGLMALKKAVDEQKLGRLTFGSGSTQWYRAQAYYDSGDWRGTWALDGGGALINQSIHYVDLVQYIMGPVVEVSAYTGRLAHERIEVEDTAVAALRFASGALGVIEGMTSAYPGFCARLEVFGSQGGVVIENDQVKEWRLQSGESYPGPAEAAHLIVGTSSADIWHHAHRRQIQDMIDAIRTDRQPLSNGEEGCKSLAVVLAVYESARTGRPVRLSVP